MPPPWLSGLIFFAVLGLLLASQIFWFERARRWVGGRARSGLRWFLTLLVYGWFGLLALVFLGAPARWLLAGDAPVLLSLLAWVRLPEVMIPVGLWSSASLLSFLILLLLWVPGFLGRAWARSRGRAGAEPDPSRRYFLETTTRMAAAVPFVGVAYGFLFGRRNYRVEEVTVPIKDLPAGLDGLRLVQLTDVHAGAYLSQAEIRRVVGLANELDADLGFHTGDFITSRGDPLEDTVAELGRLRTRQGTFGCLGNHEIYAGAEAAATELFSRQGVKILRGENTEVEVRGTRLNLIGVDYQRQPRGLGLEQWQRYFLRGAEEWVRGEQLNILLTHNPNPFPRAAELGIDLTLAGHTHGGQVQVEILDSRLSPARFITPFVSGLYSLSSAVSSTSHQLRVTSHCFLYVSRGIGTIAAPIRLGAPPEITLLTLRKDVTADRRG